MSKQNQEEEKNLYDAQLKAQLYGVGDEAIENEKRAARARENGVKPAWEWERSDFKYLVRNHSQLKNLETEELRALLLVPADEINGIPYFKRGNVRDVRCRRNRGEKPIYGAAFMPLEIYLLEARIHDPVMCGATSSEVESFNMLERFHYEEYCEKEKEKLDKIWRNL